MPTTYVYTDSNGKTHYVEKDDTGDGNDAELLKFLGATLLTDANGIPFNPRDRSADGPVLAEPVVANLNDVGPALATAALGQRNDQKTVADALADLDAERELRNAQLNLQREKLGLQRDELGLGRASTEQAGRFQAANGGFTGGTGRFVDSVRKASQSLQDAGLDLTGKGIDLSARSSDLQDAQARRKIQAAAQAKADDTLARVIAQFAKTGL